jgi:thiamine-monophosphate kinase
MPTISDVGERALIERLMRHMTAMKGMPIPFWDDASAVSLGDGRAAVLKTDMLVWKTDVPTGMTHFQAARKAVVMNFSDLGSKGVRPQAFLAALGAPGDLPVDAAEEMARGFDSGAREYGAYFIGGDTGEACDIVITGMAYGLAEEKLLLRRGGARPGDILATTGAFGKTAAAFKVLIEGLEAPARLRKPLVDSVYMPRAMVDAGVALAASGAATSSMDSSDGLAISLHDMSRSSGLGYVVERVPVAEGAREFARIHGLSPTDLALYGGEEYELVFTVKPDGLAEARRALEGAGSKLIEIGRVVPGKRITYVEDGVEKPVASGGWEHFRGLK